MTEIGFYEVQLTDEGKNDPLFQGLPGYQQVIHWHEDTFGLPDGAVRLATSENTVNQAFRVGRRAYGLQYHIEVSPDMFDIWFRHDDYKKRAAKVLGPGAPEALERDWSTCYPIYRSHTRTLFENFLKISECL
jgi:GMP synthase-like glutamine amidotransferase